MRKEQIMLKANTKAERVRRNGVGTDRQRPVVTSLHCDPGRIEEGKMSGSKEKDGMGWAKGKTQEDEM
jgi:hypothetical protein